LASQQGGGGGKERTHWSALFKKSKRSRTILASDLVLLILIGTSLLGALVTWLYAVETKA
jgi:hypothetical protein